MSDTRRRAVVVSRPCPEGLPSDWKGWWRTPASALMESGRSGRTTVLVPELQEAWFCRESGVFHRNYVEATESFVGEESPEAVLERLLTIHGVARDPAGPDFQGGVISLLSYDLARRFEAMPTLAADDLDVPLAVFAPVREALVFDHEASRLYAVVHPDVPDAAKKAAVLLDRWTACRDDSPSTVEPATLRESVKTFDEAGYCSAVNRIREYIRAGDTYQVNLSTRQRYPLHASPESVYETIRRLNPSPYMGLFRFPEFTLVCGSPELLVRVRDGKIESRPIAGTRPRGETETEDARLRAELTANLKENAEHLMLVDLLRNDLGRVSVPGSVSVPEYMTVEPYSHVMHLVSHVVGTPLASATASDIVRSVFPGGTITGAPKVRTMEIIEELEPVRRGFYTGSAGWIAGADAMELNIVIRSLYAKDGYGYVQAGAGVVADSVPEREYRESLSKARAMILALAKTPATEALV